MQNVGCHQRKKIKFFAPNKRYCDDRGSTERAGKCKAEYRTEERLDDGESTETISTNEDTRLG